MYRPNIDYIYCRTMVQRELRDGSFADIQNRVVPIYFGDDADIPKTVDILKKYINDMDEIYGES